MNNMHCEDYKLLKDAYLDGELDALHTARLEAHLADCGACRSHAESAAALGGSIRRAAYYRAPAKLAGAIKKDLREATRRTERTMPEPLRWSGLVALAATLAFVAWTLLPASKHHFTMQPAERVVYHINSNKDVLGALRNVMHHLEASPNANVVVVAHSNGVEFLLAGAKDTTGVLYENEVAKLAARGVDFRVCKNTLIRRKIDLAKVISEADLVPSGIAEISRLQSLEGYAYLKP